MIFVIPRENKTYFGTTDTDYEGDYTHPKVEQADVDYLLKIVNHRYPEARLTLDDIEAAWAGLRPLISASGEDYNGGKKEHISDENFEKIVATIQEYLEDRQSRVQVEKVIHQGVKEEPKDNPSAVSRGSDLTVADDGLLTLSGGKLTDYRLMAAEALKQIVQLLPDKKITLVDSAHYPVSGGKLDPQNVEAELAKIAETGVAKGLSKAEAKFLADLYGSNTEKVYALLDQGAFPGLSLAESSSLRYAMTEEMTLTPVDYLLRRTNYMLFISERLMEIKDAVVAGMADFYQWDERTKERYQEELDATIRETQLADLKAQQS